MAEPKTDQEPSIEEILESIRQIISEDAEPVAAPAPVKTPAPEPEPAAYTPPPEPVRAPEPAFTPPAAAKNDDADDDILDLTEKAVPARAPVIEMADVPEPEPVYTPPQPRQAAQESYTDDGLLSDMSADISAHAMARLLAGNVAVERDLPGRVGQVTLEDMTRELLRPLLKTWLDQNLPPLIERMVAKEIEKISRMALKQ